GSRGPHRHPGEHHDHLGSAALAAVPARAHFLRRWLAAALGLVGVIVLINPWAIDWSAHGILIGHAFLLGAGLSWSIAIIVTRAARPASTMFEMLPWCFLVASVLLLPLVWWHAPDGTLGVRPASWWSLAYIGFIAGRGGECDDPECHPGRQRPPRSAAARSVRFGAELRRGAAGAIPAVSRCRPR